MPRPGAGCPHLRLLHRPQVPAILAGQQPAEWREAERRRAERRRAERRRAERQGAERRRMPRLPCRTRLIRATTAKGKGKGNFQRAPQAPQRPCGRGSDVSWFCPNTRFNTSMVRAAAGLVNEKNR